MKKMSKNVLWKSLAMTTKKLTAVPDVDFDIFDFNHREHDLWSAINALREIVREGYVSEYDWRLNEMANYLEMHLEQ